MADLASQSCMPCHEDKVHDVATHSKHLAGGEGAICINCHMPKTEFGRMADARADARAIIDRVGLGERWSHYPAQLSGGEKQRVAIARAFATEPAVLFADEPTGNLDTRTGETIMELMFDLNRRSSTTLVLVTHDNSLAARCERVLSLDAGKLVGDELAAA